LKNLRPYVNVILVTASVSTSRDPQERSAGAWQEKRRPSIGPQPHAGAAAVFVDELDAFMVPINVTPDRLFLVQTFITGLSKSNAEASAVFIEEFDPRGLNSYLQLGLSILRYSRAKPSFETLHRRER